MNTLSEPDDAVVVPDSPIVLPGQGNGQAPYEGELAENVPEAVSQLKQAILSGVPWHLALLEAIGHWTKPWEVYDGRTYQYMIQGEAFDWLLLAERLCAELEGLISAKEKERLLFQGEFPQSVEPYTFRDSLGVTKYRAFLNYWYGVVVEEALQLDMEQDIRKAHRARCLPDSEDLIEGVFSSLYGEDRATLIEEFRHQAKIPKRRDLSLTNMKEFTYWLWKRRLLMWDPARVASDTRRGINRLSQLRASVAKPGYPPF